MAEENNTGANGEVTNPPELPKEEKQTTEKNDDVNIQVTPKTVASDKTYSAEEVNNLLAENTRNTTKTVKDQLYPEIKRSKDKVTDLNNKLKELETQKPKNADEQKKVDDEKANLQTQLETAKAENAQLNTKLKALEDVTVDAVNRLNELDSKLSEKDLSEYRLQRINDVRSKGDNLVDSLVVGKTKEEIDASVEKAKAEYSNIVDGVRKSMKLPSVAEEQETQQQNAQKKEEQEKLAKVTRIATPNDFKNWKGTRDEILKSAYRSAGVNV